MCKTLIDKCVDATNFKDDNISDNATWRHNVRIIWNLVKIDNLAK